MANFAERLKELLTDDCGYRYWGYVAVFEKVRRRKEIARIFQHAVDEINHGSVERIGFQFINEALRYAERFKDNGGIDYIDAIPYVFPFADKMKNRRWISGLWCKERYYA